MAIEPKKGSFGGIKESRGNAVFQYVEQLRAKCNSRRPMNINRANNLIFFAC